MNARAETLASLGLPGTGAGSWADICAWRKRVRETFIRRRAAMPSHLRSSKGMRAKARLRGAVDLSRYETMGFYWPIRGEIDVRDVAREHVKRGGTVALPVVVERSKPVEFWRWIPGERMQRGLWDIPIPLKRDVVMPDALVVPLVGFDGQGYRLGYGGGYYDRTLAAAAARPFCIGLGFEETGLRSIFPQAHDIPMDVIVTDR